MHRVQKKLMKATLPKSRTITGTTPKRKIADLSTDSISLDEEEIRNSQADSNTISEIQSKGGPPQKPQLDNKKAQPEKRAKNSRYSVPPNLVARKKNMKSKDAKEPKSPESRKDVEQPPEQLKKLTKDSEPEIVIVNSKDDVPSLDYNNPQPIATQSAGGEKTATPDLEQKLLNALHMIEELKKINENLVAEMAMWKEARNQNIVTTEQPSEQTASSLKRNIPVNSNSVINSKPAVTESSRAMISSDTGIVNNENHNKARAQSSAWPTLGRNNESAAVSTTPQDDRHPGETGSPTQRPSDQQTPISNDNNQEQRKTKTPKPPPIVALNPRP